MLTTTEQLIGFIVPKDTTGDLYRCGVFILLTLFIYTPLRPMKIGVAPGKLSLV